MATLDGLRRRAGAAKPDRTVAKRERKPAIAGALIL